MIDRSAMWVNEINMHSLDLPDRWPDRCRGVERFNQKSSENYPLRFYRSMSDERPMWATGSFCSGFLLETDRWSD